MTEASVSQKGKMIRQFLFMLHLYLITVSHLFIPNYRFRAVKYLQGHKAVGESV